MLKKVLYLLSSLYIKSKTVRDVLKKNNKALTRLNVLTFKVARTTLEGFSFWWVSFFCSAPFASFVFGAQKVTSCNICRRDLFGYRLLLRPIRLMPEVVTTRLPMRPIGYMNIVQHKR